MSIIFSISRLCLLVILLLWAVVSPAYALKLPLHSSQGDYTFPVDGPFSNMDIHLTWREVSQPPPGLGYYAMFAFYFQNRAVGYTGLQWDAAGKKAIFSVWDREQSGVAGGTVPEGQCKRFGHEGRGSQCIMPYDWKTGREYLLTVKTVQRTETGERWHAVVRDLITGQEREIGTIELKESAGYGRLTGKGVNVLEYYGHAQLNDCRDLPVVVLNWRGPFANERRLRADNVSLSYPTRFECTNSTSTSPGTGQVEQRAGGATRRLTPGGEKIHWPQILLQEE
ncbi:MAG: DUF3472 domain-containing protein [Magnetococcales bacterium]|nr:DUF3472 domain-containing protein [Magnetococcales bacterium]